MAASSLLLAASNGIRQDSASCQVVAVLLHYFPLAMFLWIAMEALYLHRLIVVVFVEKIRHFIWKSAAVAWGECNIMEIEVFGVTTALPSCLRVEVNARNIDVITFILAASHAGDSDVIYTIPAVCSKEPLITIGHLHSQPKSAIPVHSFKFMLCSSAVS